MVKITDAQITSIDVKDIRFPSSLNYTGADAMHKDPDYSCTYISIFTTYEQYRGYGLTFTLGRGNEIVVEACRLISQFLLKKTTQEIYTDFGTFWKMFMNDPRMQMMDLERGVGRLAIAGVGNALWDLWARIENKPLWKLLTDMTPEELVSNVNFKYITDFITEEEAIIMLKGNAKNKQEFEKQLQSCGIPAYVSNLGSLKHSFQKIKDTCRYYMKLEFNTFKLTLHKNAEMIKNMIKATEIRKAIGRKKRFLTFDANQIAAGEDEVETFPFYKILQSSFKPSWIEEMFNSNNIYTVFEDLITFTLAGGEMCENRIEIKQILQKNIFDILQISVARLGINDALAVYFMAMKSCTPIYPHTGGLGLCEMAQHLHMWDYICLSQYNSKIEFINYKHGYFVNPVHIVKSNYMPPMSPGYSTMLKQKVVNRWSYPFGSRWKYLLKKGYPEYFRHKQKEAKKRRKRRSGSPKKKDKKEKTKTKETK